MTQITRRTALAAFGTAVATTAQAQPAPDWPRRQIRVIVPQPPGGNLDILVRAVAEGLRQDLGQAVVVENRPGGNSVIGLEACAMAPPDGTTFCAVNIEVMSTLPHVEPALFQRFASLVPVTQMATSPSVLVASLDAPEGSLVDFVAWARGRPGLNYGSSGVGSAQQLLWEWIKARDGFAMEHVPFRGIGDAFRELVAGRVQASYGALALSMPLIRDGRIRPLAVLGAQRLPDLPGVPSMVELGYNFPYTGAWWGLAAPAGTPLAIQERMALAVRGVVRAEEFRARVLAPQFFNGIGSTPQEFAALIERERANGAEVVRLSGIAGAPR
ncbi:Bug family tripartite tricarboxylate transporter substrate binding protein [Humitalea sp. 24SJ18S-53]|uniref:Bug family tripartite tricarboxylate transporter substrate binding protein n=1 Tax=Humitalea sp. 24SJ18S-53 TaxID=3422307 RepID=UPI003D67D5A1